MIQRRLVARRVVQARIGGISEGYPLLKALRRGEHELRLE